MLYNFDGGEKMKFCNKLPKLRKDNNLSQEGLADRLSVSRQAVSKWESGQSYPDMEKMIQMCNILNCTLEDLLDDGTIRNNGSSNKSNFNNYFQDFLKFITKIYNMFCSMTFKQKIKCLVEMSFIILILYIIGAILFMILDSLLFCMIFNIPQVGGFFYTIVTNITTIIFVIVGIIIFIHLFKVRYLDYYVTVEDSNVSEKTIEQPIDKSKGKSYEEKRQEKIIIRDPKHSSFSFFNFLLKIVIFSLKMLCIFLSIFIIMSFVMLVISLFIIISHFNYGILFIWLALFLVGFILINYNLLEVVYKFIISKKQATKRIFITSILGLVLIGSGFGLSFSTVMSFEIDHDFDNDEYVTSYEEIDMNDDMLLDYYVDMDNIKYVIDNSCDNIKLEIKHLEGVNYYLEQDGYNYFLDYDINIENAYKLILNDLKNKKFRDYDSSDFIMITVTLSEDNYNKLNTNYKNY